jgi:high-affinity iron transporter
MQPLVMAHLSELKQSLRCIYTFCLLSVFIFWSTGGAAAHENHLVELRQIAQLAEYIGVDYSEAVNNGQITDNGEYQEMLEFSSIITTKISRIAESSSKFQSIIPQAKSLQASIQKKQSINTVQVLASELRHAVLTLAPQSSLPTTLMSIVENQQMYEHNCAGCHGVTGRGDGAMASNLEPSPTNFTDKERALNRSILGLYDAIANGIDGTAMPAFPQLNDQQKWSLAFYVGSLAFQSTDQSSSPAEPAISLQQIVNYSPTQLAKELPDKKTSIIEQLRVNPNPLFAAKTSTLAITRERLKAAQSAYQLGKFDQAHDLAVSAYLDGFELVENNLDARNQALRKSIETTLIKLRHAISQPQNASELESLMSNVFYQLDQAEQLLTESTLSNGTLFSASLVILLREGLEALLVIIALMTVLIRTHRQDAL